MAEHTVNVTTPPLEVGKVDVKFEVRQNGSKFGTLKISRGGVEWMQRSDKKKAFHMTWDEIDRAFDQKRYEGKTRSGKRDAS